MDVKAYTDKEYVPLNDLKVFGESFVLQITEYRRSFIEVVPLDDFSFVNIVETPALVKKRFTKNIEIKGKLEIEAENHDYILEIAKEIVKRHEVKGISLDDREKLIQKFEENQNDLTIVTEYIAKNIDQILKVGDDSGNSFEQSYPELSKYDVAFIGKCNESKLSYAISDYQSLNYCSYETGRKSLERLSELNFYEKVKVGKKFVYKPTRKLMLLLGRGS